MATLNCDLCEQAPADFMIGLILTGDQTTCCVRCLPSFTEAVTKTMEAAAADAQAAPQPSDGPDYHADHAAWERSQVPATAAQLPAEAPEDGWEDDYPQPAAEAPIKASRGRKSAQAAGTQAETAATDHE